MKTLTLLTPHLLNNLEPRTKEYCLYDAQCEGLALRIQPANPSRSKSANRKHGASFNEQGRGGEQSTGSQTWVMWERTNGKTRRITLGKHPHISPDEARQLFRLHKAGIVELEPPKAQTILFSKLAALFVTEKVDRTYKPSARGPFKDYLRSQLLPAFGPKQIAQIKSADIANWFFAYSRERPGGANQCIGHFTTIFNWGIQNGHIPYELPNPAAPIKRNRRLPRGRMLNSEQLKSLWDRLEHPPLQCGHAVDPLKLILLTGCRSGEILGLTWREVKPTRLELIDAKQGPRDIPLNKPAQHLLKNLKHGSISKFVFPSDKSTVGHITCIDQSWQTIKRHAKLPTDFRIHDLRHTYASHAILSGETLTMTGQLLGHKSHQSTQRYAHLDGSTLAKASEKVSSEISKMMGRT